MESIHIVGLFLKLKSQDEDVSLAAIVELGEMDSCTGEQKEKIAYALLEAVSDPRKKVSLRALITLSELGVQSVNITPAIVAAAGSPHLTVRWKSASLFGSLGLDTDECIDALIRLLEDDNGNVRRAAMNSLVLLMPKNDRASMAVLSEGSHFDPRVAKIARGVLEEVHFSDPDTIDEIFVLGSTSQKLFMLHFLAKSITSKTSPIPLEMAIFYFNNTIKYESLELQEATIRHIKKLTDGGIILEELRPLLFSCIERNLYSLYQPIVRILHKFGVTTFEALLFLEMAGKRYDHFLTSEVLRLLLNADKNDELQDLVFDEVSSLVGHNHLDIREAVICVLKKHCHDHQSTIELFLSRFESETFEESGGIRCSLIRFIWEATLPVQKMLSFLDARLDDLDPDVKVQVMELLIQLGEDARSVIPRLGHLMYDADPGVSSGAVDALVSFGPPALEPLFQANLSQKSHAKVGGKRGILALGYGANPYLLQRLKEADLNQRLEAGSLLSKLGLSTSDEVTFLFSIAQDESSWMRRYIADILAKSECSDERIVPFLLELLLDRSEDVRSAASDALATRGYRDDSILPCLLPLLKDEQEEVRAAALLAVGVCVPIVGDVLPFVEEGLSDTSWEVRAAAASALGMFGVEAVSVRGNLERLLRDPYLYVREETSWALEQLSEAKAA